MQLDFLIVGGGIGGAVLANLLGRAGKSVMVLEKGWKTLPQNRPEILWPATVDVLRSLIPPDLERRWLLPVQGGLVTCGRKELLRVGREVFQEAGVQPYSTANTRELLMQQAHCDYRRGVEVTRVLREVTRVLRDEGRIVGVRSRDTATGAEEDILADWTVGDDGTHSAVRRGCDLPMKVIQFPIALLGFGFDWPAALPAGEVRIWVNERRLQTGVLGMPAFPLPEGRGAALLPIWPEALRNERRLRESLRSFANQDPVQESLLATRKYPTDFTRFPIQWGRTPTFGVPGALLMGDAAHPVTPAGGQGANLSVADALVIADAALHRPAGLLAEYRKRRRDAAKRSLSLSRGATRVFSLPRVVLNLGLLGLPWAARWLGGKPSRFGRILRTVAEAFRERPNR